MLMTTLTRACRAVNDSVFIRRPIRKGLLEVILYEVERVILNQPYLITLYWAFFALSYYGLFRIGELDQGDHPMKAGDVQIRTRFSSF